MIALRLVCLIDPCDLDSDSVSGNLGDLNIRVRRHTHHSPRAATASFLTNLFLSSRGTARAFKTLARNGRI
ncbi:hypothetical protein ROHU_002841 [Labeo rohita]|uniref:Uncharacterized protein n=1 Tax=Labeo rohita TaxID=84645 RepID=A0A498NWK6_LABRO|nr:hypothetical protein ROHU_002841 [Labeo rohita]